MAMYPISVRRSQYRGTNARKLDEMREHNRNASIIERHINALLEAQEDDVHTYYFADIANSLNLDVATVREIASTIDGGHNGFTGVKHGASGR